MSERGEAQTWLRRLLEFDNCEECGKGAAGHRAMRVMGNWFAVCKALPFQPHEVGTYNCKLYGCKSAHRAKA